MNKVAASFHYEIGMGLGIHRMYSIYCLSMASIFFFFFNILNDFEGKHSNFISTYKMTTNELQCIMLTHIYIWINLFDVRTLNSFVIWQGNIFCACIFRNSGYFSPSPTNKKSPVIYSLKHTTPPFVIEYVRNFFQLTNSYFVFPFLI